MDERDNDIVRLAARASEQLDPIRTDKLAANGYTDVATRVSGARVAIDQVLRVAKHYERGAQDAERTTARLQFLLRKLFTADDECHGSVSTMPDKWLEAWNALRAEIGMEVKE